MRQIDIKPLLEQLLSEREEYQNITIPNEYIEQRGLLRSLLNMRPARPIHQEWINLQDRELKQQLIEKGIVEIKNISTLANHPNIRLWQGDITRLNVDAVVNAANSQMLGCFIPQHRCIDNAIHSSAGLQLREECERLMQAQGYTEPTGRAKITKGYNLPSRYIIHTVGPIIQTEHPLPHQEEELASCYRACLQLAEEQELNSIAFCCISTGEFCFPNELAAKIAINTVMEHNFRSLRTIIFNVFKDQDYEIYSRLLR